MPADRKEPLYFGRVSKKEEYRQVPLRICLIYACAHYGTGRNRKLFGLIIHGQNKPSPEDEQTSTPQVGEVGLRKRRACLALRRGERTVAPHRRIE